MNDILPPKRPLNPSGAKQPRDINGIHTGATQKQQGLIPEGKKAQQIEAHEPLLLTAPKRSFKKILLWTIGGLIALVIAVAAGGYLWYTNQLQPVAGETSDAIQVEIADGSTPSQIGQLLEEKKVIRNRFAFEIYTRLSGTRSKLQAGLYTLSPSETMQQIVDHIASGKIDQFSITFLPGATLAENRKGLISAGFTENEVDAALQKTYTSPLFAHKPSDTTLEGYIYGETYNFPAGVTVDKIVQTAFDEYYKVLTDNGLIGKFTQHKLNLYQAITLASIIQREVSDPTDQKQVAQVFYKRLADGLPLGSDVTAYYGADLVGKERSVSVDTPYNTRIHTELPPGPIATPGLSALKAVADPASGDYLYFLSGDDDKTYFSRTQEEHDQNIKDHCKIKCAIP